MIDTMPKTPFAQLCFIFTVLFSTPALPAPNAEYWELWDQANASNTQTIDHSQWQTLLDQYLYQDANAVNRFKYTKAVVSLLALKNYLDKLQSIDPRNYPRDEQMAYWINLYNALTVYLVVEHISIKGSAPASIKSVGKSFFRVGPWNDKRISVAGQPVSLNDIEHRILRPIWQDDRIHFVVNCASIGCPNLQPFAFTANNVEQLLSQSAVEFLSHPRGVSQNGNSLKLSSIFKWYGEDFGTDTSAILSRLTLLANGSLNPQLANFEGKIHYHYNWNLNQ